MFACPLCGLQRINKFDIWSTKYTYDLFTIFHLCKFCMFLELVANLSNWSMNKCDPFAHWNKGFQYVTFGGQFVQKELANKEHFLALTNHQKYSICGVICCTFVTCTNEGHMCQLIRIWCYFAPPAIQATWQHSPCTHEIPQPHHQRSWTGEFLSYLHLHLASLVKNILPAFWAHLRWEEENPLLKNTMK